MAEDPRAPRSASEKAEATLLITGELQSLDREGGSILKSRYCATASCRATPYYEDGHRPTSDDWPAADTSVNLFDTTGRPRVAASATALGAVAEK